MTLNPPPHAQTEDQIVRQPAIGLFAELGQTTLSRWRKPPAPTYVRPSIAVSCKFESGHQKSQNGFSRVIPIYVESPMNSNIFKQRRR